MAVNELPDELLESVFLRLASPICLVRAASTCRRWCRVVADAGFLRLYRSRNALTIGSYIATDTGFDTNSSHPSPSCGLSRLAFMPVASSPAAVTNNSDHRFSLDFLPDPAGVDTYWVLTESHGGLLLLVPRSCYWGSALFSIAVCEPLTRRCRTVIPPLDSVNVPRIDAFLLGSGGGEKKNNNVAGVSNFSVLFILYDNWSGSKTARIFSTFTGAGEEMRLRLTRSMDLGDLIRRPKGVPRSDLDADAMHFAGRAGGSLYWGTIYGVVFALDESTGELSPLTLPKCTGEQQPPFYCLHNLRAIGGAGDDDDAGRACIVRVVQHSDLEVLTPLHGSGGSGEEWTVEKTLRLPELARGLPGWKRCFFETPIAARIMAVIGRSVVMTPPNVTWPFSVDLDTMELERVYDWGDKVVQKWVFPVEPPWPPALPLHASATTDSWTSTDASKKRN